MSENKRKRMTKSKGDKRMKSSPVTVIDRKDNRKTLNAITVGQIREEEIHKNTKAIQAGDQLEGFANPGNLLPPPFNLVQLSKIHENSSELGQVIEAMQINIEGFGHRFINRLPKEDREKFNDDLETEMEKLDFVFNNINPDYDLIELRKRARKDIECTGNGYWEIVREEDGTLHSIYHIESWTMRLSKLEDEPTTMKVPYLKKDFSIGQKSFKKRFRKFVQKRGNKTVWFKEYGDTRLMDCRTGNYIDDTLDFKYHATEIIHFKLFSSTSGYGIPRYIGNLFSIFGSRASDEINLLTFQNNNIPAMAVVVNNGQLTGGTVERLEEFVESHIKRSNNRSAFLILEAEPQTEDDEDSKPMKIEIKDLTKAQTNDQLFQEYDKNNADKIRRVYRLPPIFIGKCHSSDTEYLTQHGWMLYSDIQDCEKMGTLNCDTGQLEFQNFTNRHQYDYDGHLLHMKNSGVDCLVTPNHRMFIRSTVSKCRDIKKWEYIQASELINIKGGYLEFMTAGDWIGEHLDKFTISGNIYDGDTFLRFVGYYISGGSITDTPGSITLSQNKNEYYEEMVSLLKDMNFDTGIVNSRSDEMNITICHVGLWQWLKDNCGMGCKKIPEMFLGLEKNQLGLMLDTMVNGDRGLDGAFSYSTTSKILNGQLHEICFKMGVTLTTRLDMRDNNPKRSKIYVSNGHYDNKHLIHPKKHITKVEYTGKVGCFTVPNGNLITRRGGRVLISGNSDDYTRSTADTSRKLADEQVFAPERHVVDYQVNKLILDLGVRFWTFKSNSANVTDDEDLVKLLGSSEKSGGMTPNLAREILSDVLNREIPAYDNKKVKFNPDEPFSMAMAEAVKNLNPTAPNQGQIPKGENDKGPNKDNSNDDKGPNKDNSNDDKANIEKYVKWLHEPDKYLEKILSFSDSIEKFLEEAVYGADTQ